MDWKGSKMDNVPTEPRQQPGRSGFSTPLSWRGFPRWTVYLMAIIGVGYIINPGAGVFELLPDNLPIVGNLDEGAAFMAIWYGLIEFFESRKQRRGQG